MRQNEDLFSILPKMILHDIMSRLPEKDVASTSVLSKAWADTWYTFPILSFCDTRKVGDYVKNEKNFIDYVNRSLQRFSDQGLAIKEFKLTMNDFKPHFMSKDIDFWLKLACESGVEVIELSMVKAIDKYYLLPARVIEAKSITKLVLQGRIKVDQAFMNQSIKLLSLRVLSLCLVFFEDDQTNEHIISCSPLIEDITLKSCCVLSSKEFRMLKSLSMRGLQNLKAVDIKGIHDVYIDAPNLESLSYCARHDCVTLSHGYIDAPVKVDFDMCRNLRGLYLSSLASSIITSKWFLELFRKFPFLESLKLHCCVMSATINISSDRLRKLELSNCFYKMKEINIDAPNLLSCLYGDVSDHSKPIVSFLRSSSQLEINVLINVDYLDLHNVMNFIKPHNVLTSLSLCIFIDQRIMRVENPTIVQVSSSLPRIKHLILCMKRVPKIESSFLSIVNILFSTCCPKTISLSLDSNYCSREFIKFFYEILKGNKECNCICSSSHSKCWWHGLKDVKVTCSMKIDENVNFNTMLESLPTDARREYISFTL